MLKLELYEATKGWNRRQREIAQYIWVYVLHAGVKSAKSLWLQPLEFGHNFLETDASGITSEQERTRQSEGERDSFGIYSRTSSTFAQFTVFSGA